MIGRDSSSSSSSSSSITVSSSSPDEQRSPLSAAAASLNPQVALPSALESRFERGFGVVIWGLLPSMILLARVLIMSLIKAMVMMMMMMMMIMVWCWW